MTRLDWTKLTPAEQSRAACLMTDKEWALLFPPRESTEHEPFDASGYTGE